LSSAEDRAACWQSVTQILEQNYANPDLEAARVLCAALAAHALKQFPPAWNLAIAPPGSLKTVLLESFRGLPSVHFVDEVTTNTFLSGKIDERQKRSKPASWLHRIGEDGVLVAADFSTFTSDPKKLQVILAQLRRIYDGHFSREFGTDENMEERSWKGRLTLFAGAVPDIDGHYSLFQKLGERFLRVRWPRAAGVKAGLQAMDHTLEITEELRCAVHRLMSPIISEKQVAPQLPDDVKMRVASLGEFIALARTYIERDGYSREADGVLVTEGNTRLPQQLCQIARGSALLAGHPEVNEEDYKLVRRVAFDSLPPARIAVLQAKLAGKSPFSLDLPKVTVDRAVEDLKLAKVLKEVGGFSEYAQKLLLSAGVPPGAQDDSATVPENGYR
jgi:hypothetical protein